MILSFFSFLSVDVCSAAFMDMLSGLSVNLVSFALFGLVCGTLGSVIDSAFVSPRICVLLAVLT